MNAPVRLEDFHRVDQRRSFYLSIRSKFSIALAVALTWTMLSVYLAGAWMHDLAMLTNPVFALWALTFIAFVPGFMNAFLATSLLLDARPARKEHSTYPGVTLLIAAYNEEAGIEATLQSIAGLRYGGPVEALVLNDGSSDGTVARIRQARAELIFPPNMRCACSISGRTGAKLRS